MLVTAQEYECIVICCTLYKGVLAPDDQKVHYVFAPFGKCSLQYIPKHSSNRIENCGDSDQNYVGKNTFLKSVQADDFKLKLVASNEASWSVFSKNPS